MAKINVMNRGDKKNPSWQYRFEIASIDGKRKFKSKAGFRTKEEAEKAGTSALAEYERAGKIIEPSEMSVADYLDYWLKTYCVVNLADATTHTYHTIIEKHIKPSIGHYKMKSIDVMTLQNVINDLFNEKDFSRAYLACILKVLKGSFGYATNILKLIPYNFAEPVRLPKFEPKKEEPKILSKEQMEAVLGRFRNSPYQYYPLLIGYYTGMRVGEVYGLTWDNIDLENGIIHVVQQCKLKTSNSVKGRKPQKGQIFQTWYLGSLKTSSSYRTIKIGNELISELTKYKRIQEENESEYGEFYFKHYLKEEKFPNGRTEFRIISQADKDGKSEYPRAKLVCVTESGEFRGTTPPKYVGKIAREELGIPEFHFHMLRHTHATVLVANADDMQIKDISARLGHSSIRTTMDTYVTDTEEMKTKSMEIFEKVGKLNVKLKNERLYEIWKSTKNRCVGVEYYKEKGIKFYEPWFDYEVFENWALSHGYEDDLNLIRLDKSGNYDPTNCDWIKTDNKSVKGKNVWSNGNVVKSYSVRFYHNSWQYRITDSDGREKSKLGFESEEAAKKAAESVLEEMFKDSKNAVLKRVK